MIHNYRWRLGLAQGESKYDELEQRLAQGPVITVPTITLEGDANGAPHRDPAAYARKFTGRYAHRVVTGGIGHNLPQEAPQAFADAVIEVREMSEIHVVRQFLRRRGSQRRGSVHSIQEIGSHA